MARHSTISLSSVLVVLVAGNANAQGIIDPTIGLWEPPFDHVVPASWVYPTGPNAGLTRDGEPLTGTARFLAGHMALIPKGPNRGKVLVWNFMRTISSTFDTALYYKQYWSIVDPVNKTFFNSVPPLTLPTLIPPINYKSQDLFCSGHAWTLDGDLLVCGGDKWDTSNNLLANKLCYRFDPGVTPNSNLMWVPQPKMLDGRWYPTVTAMAADSVDSKSRLMVAGGTHDLLAPKTYTVLRSGLPAAFRSRSSRFLCL